MSAFAVIYERSAAPVEPGLLEHLMTRLKHRGPDGSDLLYQSQIAMGHWHFWTTPEEVGERQPLQLKDLPFTIVFDGRLDNRAELSQRLGLDSETARSLSDTALVLKAYANWGEQSFKYFLGEYALVIFDQHSHRLVCARDALGVRTLFYAWHGTRLILASEAWAVAGAAAAPVLDERAVVQFFTFSTPEDGQTLYQQVFELLPARVWVIEATREQTFQAWLPDLSASARYRTDEDYARHFLSLLEDSVRCRTRSITPLGVLMSGGLDSTSVACLAARQMTSQQLTTLSYVFDEYPEADERQYINAVTSRYGMRSIQILCDDLYPFHHWPDWPRNPNYPIVNFYLPIRERMHQRAQQEGLRVLLTGDYGDHLYSGANDWLADLIAAGRLVEASREIFYHLRQPGLARDLFTVYLRRVARRFLDFLGVGRRLRKTPPPPDWLTPFAAQFFSRKPELQGFAEERRNNLIGLWTAQMSALETTYTSQYELELRYPFRDRRLVEFMLTIPAHQLYRQGLFRPVLRNALQGILPELVRLRSGKGSLLGLYFAGLERKKPDLQAFFAIRNLPYEKYIRPDWLSDRWESVFNADEDGAARVVPWLCLAFMVWYHHYLLPDSVDPII